MAEIKQITFSHKEVVEALVKFNGLHQGLWGLYMEFGLGAANVQPPGEPDTIPAAILPVRKIGLQKVESLDSLSVDAAAVNPASSNSKRKG
jgi:hypothetical protein